MERHSDISIRYNWVIKRLEPKLWVQFIGKNFYGSTSKHIKREVGGSTVMTPPVTRSLLPGEYL